MKRKKLKISWQLFRRQPVMVSVKQWLKYTLSFVGMLITAREFSGLVGYELSFAGAAIPFVIILVTAALLSFVLTVLRPYRLLNKDFQWEDHMTLQVVVNDYFDTLAEFPRGIAVCGVNARFESENLAPDSIHHQLYQRYFSEVGHEEFDRQVKEGIESEVEPAVDETYPLSTVSVLEVGATDTHGPRQWLMLANSTRWSSAQLFNGDNQTLVYTSALWQALKQHGITADPLIMPLIGTGNSKDNTPMSAALGIIDQYFNYSYLSEDGLEGGTPIVKALVLSIPLAFVGDGTIDLELLHHYIQLKNQLMPYRYMRQGRYKKMIE